MQLLMIGFDDRHVAQRVLEEIELTVDQAGVHLTDLALAYSSEASGPRVRQTSLAGSGPGMLKGGMLGLLAALVAPAGSVTATAAGGALGGVIAGVGDDSVDNPMMRSLASALREGRGVVLALGDREAMAKLRHVVGRYPDDTRCLDVPQATTYLMGELSKLSIEDLETSWGGSGRGGPGRSQQADEGLTGSMTDHHRDGMPLPRRSSRSLR